MLSFLALMLAFGLWSQNHERIRDAADEASKVAVYPPHDTAVGTLTAAGIILLVASMAVTARSNVGRPASLSVTALVVATGALVGLAFVVAIYTSAVLAAPIVAVAGCVGLIARRLS